MEAMICPRNFKNSILLLESFFFVFNYFFFSFIHGYLLYHVPSAKTAFIHGELCHPAFGLNRIRRFGTNDMRNQSEFRSVKKIDGIQIEGNLKPLRGNVLIQRKEPLEQTAGGLLLPVESRERQTSGRVLEVGPGEVDRETGSRIPIDVKVGDWVLFSRYGGNNLKYNAKDCVILNSNEIIAKFAEKGGNSLSPSDINPLGDTVLVKLAKISHTCESGLILSSERREGSHYKKGAVISVGNGSYDRNGKRLPMDVNAGDMVIFSEYAEETNAFKYGDEEYALIRSFDMLAKW